MLFIGLSFGLLLGLSIGVGFNETFLQIFAPLIILTLLFIGVFKEWKKELNIYLKKSF